MLGIMFGMTRRMLSWSLCRKWPLCESPFFRTFAAVKCRILLFLALQGIGVSAFCRIGEGGVSNDVRLHAMSHPVEADAALQADSTSTPCRNPVTWLMNYLERANKESDKPFDCSLILGPSYTSTYSFGFGVAWQHKNTLLVAADVRHELWSNCRVPAETLDDYVPMKGFYKDMTKIALGAQWTPDPLVKSYWKRIQYRAGMNFSTPFLKINDRNGPVEFRMGAGVGLPITNKINNRSVVNVGLQWMRRSASGNGMVKEDYLLINLGMTFNERWFVKYKIE